MAVSTKPLEIGSFKGGITDFLFSNDLTKAAALDNYVIEQDEKIITRPGSIIDSETEGQIPPGAQRISALINYDSNNKLFILSGNQGFYRNPVAYATLTGPSGNNLFNVGGTSAAPSFAQWNRQVFLVNDSYAVPSKIYQDGSGNYQLRTAGLPDLATSPTGSGTAGGDSFLYAFHYHYSYTVGSQQFQDDGPVTTIEVSNVTAPDVNPITISGIPALSNGATYNWDTANIKVFIYRTISGGTDFFKVGEVTNGTTVYVDTTSDSAIVDNLVLYTADGTLSNDPPPLAKYIHIVNNTGYYAGLKEGTELDDFTYAQSIPFDPDSVPVQFRDTVEDVIVGISSVKSIPIVLCKKHIYRVEGQLDQFGAGFMSHVRISDTAGCVSNLSIVQAENGLYWAGNDGFYYSDGYQVMKISDGNNKNYRALMDNSTVKKRIYGKYNETDRRILWGVQKSSSSLDIDSAWVLDLNWGIKEDMCFTTWSGESFAPTAWEYFDGFLYRADKRGYVFIHSDQYFSDPKIDITEFPVDWYRETIIWNYLGLAINFGSTFQRKWVTKILLTAKNATNTSIQINAINDDGRIFRALTPIRWRRNFIWGDPDFSWGDPSCVWAGEGLIEEWRRMPAGGLRVSYLQIQITNAYSVISNSDTVGKATFNPATKQAILDTAATADWPLDSVDYFISTEADGYVTQFPIINRGNDTITCLDSGGKFPLGSLKWVIKGYKKDEVLNLLSFCLHYGELSSSQKPFQSGELGGNVG